MDVSFILAKTKYNQPSFKSAVVKINALSDTHGELSLANSALEEMRQRKEDIFCKQGAGKANVVAISGDWFIDGAKKGYYSDPKKEKAFFQLDVLNSFISGIKGIAKNTTTLFTPGNHEFDGGVPLLSKIFSKLDAEVLMTNLHLPTSSSFSTSIKDGKVINQKVLEVEDDKNPDLKHKLLFLGISPVNLSYYQNKLSGVSLVDNSFIAQRNVKEDDYQATISDCVQRIEEFKKENPKGLVVLMSHTGVGFADNLAKRTKIDLVFDGHEHKDEIRYSNGTPIVPMSQNFKKIVNASIKFDDNGNLSALDIDSFNPLKNQKKGALAKLYSSLFKDDIKKQYAIKTKDESIKELGIDGVRTGNSHLANFVTDSILSEIQKHEHSVDFFAINASAIRHPLAVSNEPEVSHLDVINVLSGIKEEEGQIMTTRVSGYDLLSMVVDNVLFNSYMPKQNPLMQYSGLEVDRTAILAAYEVGCELSDLYPFVINKSTGEPIEADEKYKIANTEKYFDKSQNKFIKMLKIHSDYLGYTVQELFEDHFNSEKDNLEAKCDVRYK